MAFRPAIRAALTANSVCGDHFATAIAKNNEEPADFDPPVNFSPRFENCRQLRVSS